MRSVQRQQASFLGAGLALAALAGRVWAADADPVHALEERNQALERQVDAQQREIDELRARLDRLEDKPVAAPAPSAGPEAPAPAAAAFSPSAHPVRISGEAGFAYFHGGGDSAYPKGDFHVDDARLFVEAPVWGSVYFFGGLELTTREQDDDTVHPGELYLDAEDLFRSGRDRLTLRIGKFNIPFGEEYQTRGVVDNPLVTHSATDLWGYDTGVEAFGALGPVQFNVAAQNGARDGRPSATVRLGMNPVRPLHVSVSAHTTGRTDETTDVLTPVWFAGAFFRGLAPDGRTRSFSIDVYEADATWSWATGHAGGAFGWADFADDNPVASDGRRLTFGQVEAVQHLSDRLYGAVRYSAIRAPRGYPLAGEGNGGKYFYNPYAPLTTDLERLSLGLGILFAPPLVWKVEYTWEHGHLAGGQARSNEDLFSSEVGVRF